MTKVLKNYPEYPNTESYEIYGKTYVVTSLSSHQDRSKIVISFDTYDGNSGSTVNRVGKLFKQGTKIHKVYRVYAEFIINKTDYILDIKTGEILDRVDFGIKTESLIKVPKGIKATEDSTLNDLLVGSDQLRHMMLGRMQSDCEYYLGFGGRNSGRLWAGSVEKQIYYMKALYYSFSEKPQYINIDKINQYEKDMKIRS